VEDGNFAVNNDATPYPRAIASFANAKAPPLKLIDGNYWYHRDPPNRWTCEGSPHASDSIVLDLGRARNVHTVKLYALDDGAGIFPPARIDLERWDGSAWVSVPGQSRSPRRPEGRRANVIHFPALDVQKLRVVLHHADRGKSGLTECEVWGESGHPVPRAPGVAENLAHNPGGRLFPKASASYTDRFGGTPAASIDGKVNFLPTPLNRWTSFESPHENDWLEVDLGAAQTFRRIDLAVFDDGAGVQPPARYDVETWDGTSWQPVVEPQKTPLQPVGGEYNEVRFRAVDARKVRVVFTHAGRARSGLTELLIWNE
jgi:hypothetical protein